MYRKTVIATITLLVAAIALSAWAFGVTQNCCDATQNRYMAKERQSDDELNCHMLKKNSGASPESAPGAALQNDAQTATIEINDKGFEPSSLKLKAGAPAKVTFVRKTDATCAKEVVIKEYNINRNLPLNEPVTVEFTPRKGEFTFACGIDMIKGKLIVE
jgi:plastocyanin